ncbi:DUF47 domain-containing protein [Fundidesulfovibrio putealis]|jgi:uncharacterized protein Yka (UPF0111/DUF47 family)|uniref:DUF47 domain-containing protein n=1 Tax=Fundidesulfovibrio putealis TaxID=270496 RepID=UPI0003FD6805|nr:DUF47 family protein [Fundidesulfovibrio putealis]KAF0231968.1 MAG: hypothetical protein FD177_2662 [Desulfovibrionaceae bacterium]
MGFSLFPKEVKFFEMFKDQNRKLIKAVTILDELFHSLEDMEDRCTRINIIEAEANTISRSISTELSSTFITPLDREDIHQINITQEALINIVKATATRIGLLECGDVLYPSRRLVRSLKVMIEEAGLVLDKLSKNKDAREHVEIIKSHKYECEMLLLVGLGELYDTKDQVPGGQQLMHIIKWNHIYGRIEQAVDRAERLSDVLEGVLLKHA